MNSGNKSQVISVSLPAPVYDALITATDHYNLNRSAFIASAIADALRQLGLKVGETSNG